jgi:malate dehydrogenase (oxaloacetate-decarboxylating)
MNYDKESLNLHEKLKGKLEIKSKMQLKTKYDLSLAYTPGVAKPCLEIAKNKDDVYKYTIKGNTVAIITDGSAVLGLGNIGGRAALPVMEGKAILFKEFANIDAFPICLEYQDTKKTIDTIKNIATGFGGINLEDIKAPECFIIEKALQDIGIPVMHDDQHGTAVVALAGLINALKVVKKELNQIKVVFNGAGAAALATAKLIMDYGVKDIIMCDSKGIIYENRPDLENNIYKKEISTMTNKDKIKGNLNDAIINADVFMGLSVKDALNQEMIRSMNKDSIIMAMANPNPEIMPNLAKSAGAKIIATGRSDFPNQINNVLGFPGIFRGALDARATKITREMKLGAAIAIASIIKNPTTEEIIPLPTNKKVVPLVANAVKKAWLKSK